MKNVLALLTLMSTGCLYYGDLGPAPAPAPVPGPGTVVNYAPVVESGDAFVFFDKYYYDDIWSFEAFVFDADDAILDLYVYADIYDDYTGQLVESLELQNSGYDPDFWFSDWYGSSLYLDPYGSYTVDIIAVDSLDDFGVLTLQAQTYYY